MEVTLKSLQETHLANVFKWLTDPFVAENIGLRREPSESYTKEWFENAKRGNEIWAFAICCEDTHVGNVVLDNFDGYLGTIRLSVYIGDESFRGKGVAGKAINIALGHAFHEIKVNKVWLIVHEKNQGAFKLYKNIGFQIEGKLREAFVFQGKLIDVFYMSMLKKECLLLDEV